MREDHQTELSRLTLDLEDESSRTTSMDRRLTDLRREVRNIVYVEFFQQFLWVRVLLFDCVYSDSKVLFLFGIKGGGVGGGGRRRGVARFSKNSVVQTFVNL